MADEVQQGNLAHREEWKHGAAKPQLPLHAAVAFQNKNISAFEHSVFHPEQMEWVKQTGKAEPFVKNSDCGKSNFPSEKQFRQEG